jgi:hypothetical protein
MMTIQQMMRSVRAEIMVWYDKVSGKADARRKRYMHYALLGVGTLTLLLGAFGGYRWYVHIREREAQKTLSFCLDEYFKAQRGQSASWQELADRCLRAADKHSSSYLYPHFKALQADALVHVGDLQGALVAMKVVHGSMRSSDPLYALFMLKYSLMQLDSADEAISAQGLSELTALAHNQANTYADAAQFYLGQYYIAHDQPDKAQQEWKTLSAQRRIEPGMSSPWAELVASKVTQ